MCVHSPAHMRCQHCKCHTFAPTHLYLSCGVAPFPPNQQPTSTQQILHAYMAEPYSHWAGLTRGSAEYKQLKAERAEQLWGLVEQVRQ